MTRVKVVVDLTLLLIVLVFISTASLGIGFAESVSVTVDIENESSRKNFVVESNKEEYVDDSPSSYSQDERKNELIENNHDLESVHSESFYYSTHTCTRTGICSWNQILNLSDTIPSKSKCSVYDEFAVDFEREIPKGSGAEIKKQTSSISSRNSDIYSTENENIESSSNVTVNGSSSNSNTAVKKTPIVVISPDEYKEQVLKHVSSENKNKESELGSESLTSLSGRKEQQLKNEGEATTETAESTTPNSMNGSNSSNIQSDIDNSHSQDMAKNSEAKDKDESSVQEQSEKQQQQTTHEADEIKIRETGEEVGVQPTRYEYGQKQNGTFGEDEDVLSNLVPVTEDDGGIQKDRILEPAKSNDEKIMELKSNTSEDTEAETGVGTAERNDDFDDDIVIKGDEHKHEDEDDHDHSDEDGKVGGRFNYASLDAGAIIMASNPEAKGTSKLLIEDRDAYSLSPCEARKWFVVGLSEDILVDTIVIANYERYSSTVREFQVLGSHQYPVNEWMLLGKFQAGPESGEQTFVPQHRAWARYLKFRFLSHYDNEFYCTLSLIRVYGSTHMESIREEIEKSSRDLESIRDLSEKTSIVLDDQVQVQVDAVLPDETDIDGSDSTKSESSEGTSKHEEKDSDVSLHVEVTEAVSNTHIDANETTSVVSDEIQALSGGEMKVVDEISDEHEDMNNSKPEAESTSVQDKGNVTNTSNLDTGTARVRTTADIDTSSLKNSNIAPVNTSNEAAYTAGNDHQQGIVEVLDDTKSTNESDRRIDNPIPVFSGNGTLESQNRNVGNMSTVSAPTTSDSSNESISDTGSYVNMSKSKSSQQNNIKENANQTKVGELENGIARIFKNATDNGVPSKIGTDSTAIINVENKDIVLTGTYQWLNSIHVTKLSTCPENYTMISHNLNDFYGQGGGKAQAYLCAKYLKCDIHEKQCNSIVNGEISSTKSGVITEIQIVSGVRKECPAEYISAGSHLYQQDETPITICYLRTPHSREARKSAIHFLSVKNATLSENKMLKENKHCFHIEALKSFFCTAPLSKEKVKEKPNVNVLVPSGSSPKKNPSSSSSNTGSSMDSIFKTITSKVLDLELDQSLLKRYVEDLVKTYAGIFGDLQESIDETTARQQDLMEQSSTFSTHLDNLKTVIEKQSVTHSELAEHIRINNVILESLRADVHWNAKLMGDLALLTFLSLSLSFVALLWGCNAHRKLNLLIESSGSNSVEEKGAGERNSNISSPTKLEKVSESVTISKGETIVNDDPLKFELLQVYDRKDEIFSGYQRPNVSACEH